MPQAIITLHKSITVRIGLDENSFKEAFKIKQTFENRESHIKFNYSQDHEDLQSSTNSQREMTCSSSSHTSSSNSDMELNSDEELLKQRGGEQIHTSLQRKFKNKDMATCWLNSCLQLVLTALDYCENLTIMESDLGQKLLVLKSNENRKSLDPENVKNILVNTEDLRITVKISELEAEIDDPFERQHQIESVQRLDLYRGQQCVRDFFICLQENLVSWPDVTSTFMFTLTHSTECLKCNHVNRSETFQLYVELPVPPNHVKLNDHVEEFFNTSELVGMNCDNCQSFVQKEKSSKLTQAADSEFLIIILTRAIETIAGCKLIVAKTDATNDIFIR